MVKRTKKSASATIDSSKAKSKKGHKSARNWHDDIFLRTVLAIFGFVVLAIGFNVLISGDSVTNEAGTQNLVFYSADEVKTTESDKELVAIQELFESNQVNIAIDKTDRLIAKSNESDLYELFYYKGLICREAQNTECTFRAWDSAYKIAKILSPEFVLSLAEATLETGRKDIAIEYYQEALSLYQGQIGNYEDIDPRDLISKRLKELQ